MINLFIAVLLSATIALILKYSESRQKNRYAVTTANYLIAFCVSFVLAIKEGAFHFSFGKDKNVVSEFFSVLSGTTDLFSSQGSFIWAVSVGMVAGVLYFLGFIYIQKSICENGVGITGAFSKLAIFIPMALSMILWKEIPTAIQWIGIAFAVVAIVLIHMPEKGYRFEALHSTLIFLFLAVGLAEFSNKFFQRYARSEFKALFLFVVFLTAFFISFAVTYVKNRNISKSDIVVGILVGIPNMLTSYFLIRAFSTVKTTIAFPIYSAGSIFLINLGGVFIFKEQLSQKEKYSIVLTVIAIILMNS